MPINRLNLKLDLSLLNIAPTSLNILMPSTKEHLKNNFDTLHNQIRQMPIRQFKEAVDIPDYSEIRQCGFFAMRQGFQLVNNNEDCFIHARREDTDCKGNFSGDKFHISVLKEQMPQAFKALSGLLFSENSPVNKWKITDTELIAHQSRVGTGAQFTLYIKPDQENSQYSVFLLHKTRQFIEHLEFRLAEKGITPGQYPESDVRPEKWKYLSYRNELRSERDGGEIQQQALREEPFYRLMTA
ncbi:type III secretion system effector phosphothreonine lyase [Salmonella enterica]|nr:type III secretion system effector phosphothreonine lyase [Salmonella enterica]ECJ5919030.1 type III secretion system effector phosphothreonine lyase [Salmonella enterica subsp. salamae]HCM1832442.1 type III secretion system effector phosphothreonine lyase [Salmonella enterica subsp. salamae serovar 48:z81:z39]HCM1882343.1 type III secretion system effector phosphothreonine lyase [Salmonella enterica subsp. salamae serovar 60:z10:z39]EAN4946067.1 type III secretion system effector phosphothr